MEYPKVFLDNMKQLLGEEYESFTKAINSKNTSGIRINESKIGIDEFIKIAPFDIEKIPFVSNGFYINDTDAWSKHPYYFAGLYYIQEPSAMLPADNLPVNEGDRVLDLCAAPGGKSTMLSTRPVKYLVSNDISFSRTIPLVKNLEIFGSCRSFVINEDPGKLEQIFPSFFDKILVDAPCSGEGMFRKEDGLIKSYESKGPEYYVPIQKSILKSAVKMLKPDGMIMYSTCTFSNLEDEEVILEITRENKDITLVDINDYEGFAGTYKDYINELGDSGVIHVFPHKMKGEGHFLCLLKKADSDADKQKSQNASYSGNLKTVSFNNLSEEVKLFLNSYKSQEVFKTRDYLCSKDGNIYILPNGYEEILNQKIHFLRTGVLLGSVNKAGKFAPSTSMALANEFGEFENSLDLDSTDSIVTKFLKGETLIIDNDKYKIPQKGYVMIKADSFPLGFAKYDGSKFKNLYEKGWVLK